MRLFKFKEFKLLLLKQDGIFEIKNTQPIIARLIQ